MTVLPGRGFWSGFKKKEMVGVTKYLLGISQLKDSADANDDARRLVLLQA